MTLSRHKDPATLRKCYSGIRQGLKTTFGALLQQARPAICFGSELCWHQPKMRTAVLTLETLAGQGHDSMQCHDKLLVTACSAVAEPAAAERTDGV
jgi:hypothetical protein